MESQYNSLSEWRKSDKKAYMSAYHRGMLNEICDMFVWDKPKTIGIVRKPRGYWTKERCIESAKGFNGREEWKRGCRSSYSAARKNKWLDECCGHMLMGYKAKGYWTKERCIESPKGFNSRSEWQRGCGSSYATARTNKWLDECCVHMINGKKANGYWTKERCIESAKGFNTRKKWQRGCGSSYSAARRNKWLDECCAHMLTDRKPMGYWTKERCIESAKGFNSRSEWRMGCGSSYSIALKNKWLDECCVHMVSGRKVKKK